MKMLKNILMARRIIKDKINKTPLILAKDILNERESDVYFKSEVSQKTGSFKIRGVLNRLHYLTPSEKKRGIIALSVGSHALSLSFVASKLNIPLTIVMPKIVPQNKVKLIKSYGANVVLANRFFSRCKEIQNKHKLTMIHPFDDLMIIAGQGTIGLEIIEELSNVNMVFIPIGGGGLISGIAAAIKLKKPEVKIIGVEPIGAPSMFKSIQDNKIIHLNKYKTIADCLVAPCVGKHTFKYAKKYVDEFILVSDKEIIEALRKIWQISKIKVEPSAAVSLAAIIFKKIKIPQGSKIVSVLTGGNISNEYFKRIISNNKNTYN